MVRIDLVRKSSGGIDVKFRFENDLAAWRKARNEAVRFDLNAALKGDRETFLSWVSALSSSKTLKSNCSTATSGDESG